ncbi:MAG TPA: hypothetical protein PKN33_19535 [Phycisphaerae bacterium]|nr:hypothetical protein [Phycisphaerales bacterium]HNO80246.1 hypothetical protein [Phycisphaerae bacterium]
MNTMNKRWTGLTLGVALILMTSATGCFQFATEKAYWDYTGNRAIFQVTNSSQTAADRMHTHRQVINQDARSMIDDIDFILLRERPSRLSRWHNR